MRLTEGNLTAKEEGPIPSERCEKAGLSRKHISTLQARAYTVTRNPLLPFIYFSLFSFHVVSNRGCAQYLPHNDKSPKLSTSETVCPAEVCH